MLYLYDILDTRRTELTLIALTTFHSIQKHTANQTGIPNWRFTFWK
jgi:hypothetical protein